MTNTGASFARGQSVQDVETPKDLLDAVVRRWGPLAIDLAATRENRKADRWLGPGSPIAEDSLSGELRGFWTSQIDGAAWLNPPFGDLGPWVRRCSSWLGCRNSRGRTLLLVPASVGSNWWRDHVHEKAAVHFLNGRVKFVGHSGPYPKDLALCVYGDRPGYHVWNWRAS